MKGSHRTASPAPSDGAGLAASRSEVVAAYVASSECTEGEDAGAGAGVMTGPDTFTSEHVAWLRVNRLFLGISLAGIAVGVAAIPIGAASHLPRLEASLIGAGLLGAAAAIHRKAFARRDRGAFTVTPSGITIDGESVARRSELRSGFVVPSHKGRTLVRLERPYKLPVELEVADTAEGRRILHALGFDASQSRAMFWLPSRALYEGAAGLAMVALAFTTAMLTAAFWRLFGPAPAQVAALLGVASFLTLLLWRTRLTVGADGVLVSWLGRARFVRYDDVTDVAIHRGELFGFGFRAWSGVRIHLHGKAPVELAVASSVLDIPRTELIAERIREGLQSYRRGDGAADAALVARAGRPVAEWVEALRAIGAGSGADHRTAPVVHDRLWKVVEDVSAAPVARAGAAVALAASKSPESNERLRLAAEATAVPKLRLAIEAARPSPKSRLRRAQAVFVTLGPDPAGQSDPSSSWGCSCRLPSRRSRPSPCCSSRPRTRRCKSSWPRSTRSSAGRPRC